MTRKTIPLLLSVFFCISVMYAQVKPFEERKSKKIEKIINSQWTFNYFPDETADKGFESPRFDDSKWSAISLPHTWSTYETTGELHPVTGGAVETDSTYWIKGWGWYRKHFSISRDYSDRKVFIEFEGVQRYCKVWLNGKYLGDHNNGFGSFDFDITQFLNPGEDNVLAVAVNLFQKDEVKSAPLAEWDNNVNGGIFRNLTIVLKDKLYIPMQGCASHEGGTFVSTPKVSEKEGIVRVQTWVKNDNTNKRNCTVQTSIADTTNKIIQIIKSEAVINPGQLYKFDQTGKLIKNPHLWTTEAPYLYKVYTEVIDGKEVVDTYTSPLGFRWSRWDNKDGTLYLNDKKIVIRDGTHHQKYPWLRFAIPKWITIQNYTEISEKPDYNFLRMDNCPDDIQVYELADKYGIVIDVGAPAAMNLIFPVGDQEQLIKEMIRRGRNHPSIIFWSMGNETNHTFDSKFAQAEDTTRIITAKRILSDSVITSFKQTNEMPTSTSQADMAGNPARIVLTGLHRNIVADRGSVAIITADIIDSKGNHIDAATNTVRWNISGPAMLMGPKVFESDKDKHHEIAGMGYLDMPFSNVIRSTGKPGKIHITASASGLISGSLDILAEDIKPDNSIIVEPLLIDEGRQPVKRIALDINKMEEVPREINLTDEEINLAPSDKAGYVKGMRDYILKINPSVDSATIEFKALVNLFASYLLNNKGNLYADDYNFNVGHYNNCRLISGYINGTKLPQLFKEGLKKYYASSIIYEGSEKNAGDEMNWLNWIPSGGTVVIVQTESTSANFKNAIFTNQTGLAEIISVVYPQFVNFSEEGKERALIFISKMNPYIHPAGNNEQNIKVDKEKITNISYTAEKGQPILIPLFKFISE